MKKAFLIATIVAIASFAAPASVVLSDSFTYPDGPITSAPSTPWIAHSGSGSMMVSNNMLVVSRLRGEDVHADLAGGPYLASDPSIALYSSFTMVISNDLPTTAGTYFSHFRGTNVGAATDFGARVFVTLSNTVTHAAVPDGQYRVSIGNGAAATNNDLFGQIDMDLDTNTTYTIVTRFVPNTGLATIWLNPNLESDTSATAADPGTAVAPNPFNVFSYAFRQNAGEGTVYVDNLKIGTHFNDVAGANTAPTISSIDDQNIPASSSTGPLDFIVGDAETAAGSLTVTASSSSTSLIPNNPANLTFGGSGANRTINVTPVSGQQGQSTITVNVSDGVNTSFTTFLVRVGAPVISAIPDQTTYTNVPIPSIPFTIGDAEGDTLTLSAASSNPTLITSGNIVFGGSGSNRTVTLTPQAGQIGLSSITISVGDGHTTNTTSFSLTVSPYLGLVFADDFTYTNFVQPNALYQATGSPWQTIPPGTAYELQVTNPLAYLNHTNTEDLGAALTNAPYFPSNAVIFYTKFDVNFSFLPSNLGEYFLHLKSSDTDNLNFRCRVFAQTTNAAAGKFRLAISINSASASAQLPVDLDLDTTYTVVTRYNSATSASTLWVNPASESSQSVSATDLPNTSTIGGIGLREANFMGDMTIAALRVGTKFTDVVTAVAPIPLGITRSGSNIILTWSNPVFSLTSATSVGGPYTTINGATSPYTNAISGGQQYFRLQH
jgi:hypothetical protein